MARELLAGRWGEVGRFGQLLDVGAQLGFVHDPALLDQVQEFVGGRGGGHRVPSPAGRQPGTEARDPGDGRPSQV